MTPGIFGPWRPDIPDLNNPGVTVAYNVSPAQGSVPGSVTYRPVKSAALYANTSMSSRPLGAGFGRDSIGASRVYGGSKENLYKINPLTKSWTAISKPGGYATSENDNWRFNAFGKTMIATNYSDYPQYINMDVNTQFADLTTLFKAKYSANVREFQVFASTSDSLDLDKPNRVRWSAFDDQFDYNFSLSTQSDFQDIAAGGNIMGLVGGEAGYILMQDRIVKMTYRGDSLIFQFDPIPETIGKGVAAAESVIRDVEGMTFYLSNDGFYMFNGGGLTSIGAGKIDQFILNKIDPQQYHYMSVAADPREKLVYWTYCSMNAATVGVPDSVLIYNYQTGEWSEGDATVPYLFNSLSLPTTIEELGVYGSIEQIPAPFDSPAWAGGAATLWGSNAAGAIYTLSGENLTGVIETQEQMLAQVIGNENGDRVNVMRVRPFVHGSGNVSVQAGHRQLSTDNVNWTDPKATNSETGFAPLRYTNRFHRFRFTLTGGWKQAMSYQVDANPAGWR